MLCLQNPRKSRKILGPKKVILGNEDKSVIFPKFGIIQRDQFDGQESLGGSFEGRGNRALRRKWDSKVKRDQNMRTGQNVMS